MSAFICTKKHINTLVSYGVRHDASALLAGPSGRKHWEFFKKDPDQIVNILYKTNVDSVQHRYNDTESFKPSKHKPEAIAFISPVAIIKLCDCFHYQASEVENYEDTVTHQIIESVRNSAIDNLPGYKDAPWTI